MKNDIQFLKDTSKVVSQKPDTFIALEGETIRGNGPFAGIKLTSYQEPQYRSSSITHYCLDVLKSMRIDSNYSDFYNYDKEQTERFETFSDGIKAYNETILNHSQNPEQSIIYNVPVSTKPIALAYVKGQGYNAKPESCVVLQSNPMPDHPESSYALLYRSGAFAIAENVPVNQFGKLDLSSIPRPDFQIEGLQDALDVYAEKSKCEVLYNSPDTPVLFHAEEIGMATLKEQENTFAKKEEETVYPDLSQNKEDLSR